jgi:phosphoribosyl-ATP pyrophosphohydrolase/phosphoribosyl-AMP cyclohydrolase/histidinol dehydrogenase
MTNRIPAAEFAKIKLSHSLDAQTLAQSQAIVDEVRAGGESAIRKFATQFNERTPDQQMLIQRNELEAAANRIDAEDLALLERVAKRIRDFAQAQRDSISVLETPVPGGCAGHSIVPIQNAGCYAPAGRFALPSTVLMTAVTAKVAGCEDIVVASPNPSDIILAAAFVAGADQVLAVGGAHAIAAMAYGFEGFTRRDLIAGPGNRWVTAAKKIVNGDCGIDMLAGPSELALVADGSADPATIAADLLAQAEHDVDARPFLILTDESMADAVDVELKRQMEELPTGEVARQSLAQNGAFVMCDSVEDAIDVCNQLAPEHLELHLANAESVAAKIRHAGCIFIGHQSAEVFGDYGVGPNHTLPTAGTARFSAGLNVFTFLRIRTWLKLDQAPPELIADTARLAEIEGLIGHQRSGLRRAETS